MQNNEIILWDSERLIKAIGDDIIFISNQTKFKITNVVFDNRKIVGESLFIAKKGENTDGHKYIEQTLQNTQAIILVNADFEGKEKFVNNPRIILVKDTVKAMEKMAKYARDTIKGKVFGITGSLGKTTTKELYYACFSQIGKTHCNIMSFNNYMGVMTTLCNLPENTDYAIIEMGMSAKGEMEQLSSIVRPDITTILNIASAHLEFFNEEKDIAYAKAEIFKYQKKEGFTILNKDCKYFDILSREARNNGINKIYTFSEKNNADVYLKSYTQDGDLYKLEYNIGNFLTYNPDYNVAVNLMSLLCACKGLNIDLEKIKPAIQAYGTPRGRNNIEKAEFDCKCITLINGTYNAVNPLAFTSGLNLLKKLDKEKKFGRRICIFGDIREAGDKTNEFLLSLKQPIIDAKIDILICVGDKIKVLYDAIKGNLNCEYYKESSEVVPLIKAKLKDNDIVFIKASKGIKTWKILDEITGYPTEIFI